MTNVTIQKATEKSLTDLMPLVRAYHEFEGVELTDAEREIAVNKLLSGAAPGCIWMVMCDDVQVGYIVLCTGFSIEFSGVDAFVDEFYIHTDYRGKGIGSIVLELLKAEAIKMDIRAIHLEVARTNNQAKRLYSRAGFRAREKYVLMSVEL